MTAPSSPTQAGKLEARALCSKCGKRRVVVRVKGGTPKALKDHDLCRQCWRSQVDHDRGGGKPA